MLEELIKLANHLDQLGHKDLADKLDAVLNKTADWGDDFNDIMEQLPEDPLTIEEPSATTTEENMMEEPIFALNESADEDSREEELFESSFAADKPAIKKEASSSLDLSALFVSESSFYGS